MVFKSEFSFSEKFVEALVSLFTLFTIPLVSKGLRASLPFPNELRPVKAYPEFPLFRTLIWFL